MEPDTIEYLEWEIGPWHFKCRPDHHGTLRINVYYGFYNLVDSITRVAPNTTLNQAKKLTVHWASLHMKGWLREVENFLDTLHDD